MKRLTKRNNLLLWIVTVWLATACSTTKHLPEGETLYTGIKDITVQSPDPTSTGNTALEEVEGAISIAPNNSFLGSAKYRIPFPFGLWVYNRFERYEKGVGKWIFDKLASEPVLLSTVNPETRVKVATNLLRNYGYFNGQVTYQVDSTKNPRAVKLSYDVDMGRPYFLDSIMYEGFMPRADSLIRSHASEQLIHKGDNFNVNQLEAERQRLVSLMRDNGYYYFRSDFITFLADTLIRPGYVNLKVVAKKSIPQEGLKQYYLGNTSVYLTGYNGERPTDSLKTRTFTVHYPGEKPGIRFGVLRGRFLYRKGELYSQKRQDYTQEALARLGAFKFTEMNYIPRGDSLLNDTLDIRVNAMFDLPYDSELEFNVTTKSTKQTGPGAIFNLSRRNFRGMGASLNLKLRGSYEWQTSSTVDGESSVMNSYELGAELSLEFPRIILPFIKKRINPFKFPSNTYFRIYGEQVNRARYFKMLSFGGTVSYDFRSSPMSKHTVTPFQLVFNTLQHRTAAFDSIATANPMLFHSLDDQFIPSISYTYTYDNAFLKKKNQLWWEGSVTSAGNITSLIYAAFGQKFSQKDKKLLGTPFAQFMKFTSDIRLLHNFNEKHQLATRLMGGIIYSYGNKTIAPYSEQFYVGGANSIRAFTIRSIGPGSFHPKESAAYSYVDETGDLKLEANAEYRFRLLSNLAGGNLNGAVFLDAGNVWLLRDDPARPGAQFTLDKFFDHIALGTGVGIRYDMSFIVLRLDMGIALHVPYETGKGGYYNIPRFKDGLGIHFAIGYPF